MQQSVFFLLGVFLIIPSGAFPKNIDRIKRFANSLPVFVAFSGVKSSDGILKIGVFSDAQSPVNQSALQIFKNLKPWANEEVRSAIGHKSVEVVFLDADNIESFDGQIIWVLDVENSAELIKNQTKKGVYTVGSQEPNYQSFLFTTFIYENKSLDPKIEKWRLIQLIANCEISSLRYIDKMKTKKYFVGKNCD
ncbi:MAG: hypothetical protein B6244_07315 [Candidatus Cloacimonetes bacterium 4572_55]|nr:MAG: hypothetical protein B6244_07315 [Candidatus Cloacimonetes bacterium 4572_55]